MSQSTRRGELLIATHNRGKVAELEALLAGSGWRLQPLDPDVPEFVEDGETFADNSRGKALYYAQVTGLPALADDSGLEIDAIGGDPGVRSARYLDPDMPQARRNLEVLALLSDVPEPERGARFVCYLTLAYQGRIVHETVGTCSGRIATAPRGDGGFGYDPIFVWPATGRTFAELSREEKSGLSHRGRAVREMAEFLSGWSLPESGPVVS